MEKSKVMERRGSNWDIQKSVDKMMTKPKEKTYQTSFRINKDLHQRLKVYCAQHGVTVTEWVINLIEMNLP